jgi:hypothetical protein
MPRLLPDTIRKISVRMVFSEEQLFTNIGLSDSRYQRKAEYKTEEISPETWARYYEAKNAFRILADSEFMEWGSPEAEPEVAEPYAKRAVTYLETHEEWLERCRQLQKESE